MSRYFLTVRMLNYAFLPSPSNCHCNSCCVHHRHPPPFSCSVDSISFLPLITVCSHAFLLSFYPQLLQLSPASFSQLLNIVITVFSLLSMWKLISKEEKLRLCWVSCAASRHPHWKKNLVCFLLLLSDIRAYQKATNISLMFKLFTECLFETEWDCLLDLHTQL